MSDETSLSTIVKGTYQTECHVYAVLNRTNSPIIILDPTYRSYYGWIWDMNNCTYEVQDQWKRLHLQPGERVQIILDNGISSKIEREQD